MARAYKLAPAASRRRGLPAIGIEVEAPAGVELVPIGTGDSVVRCEERRPDGAPIGRLEVAMFSAGLIIDRDGVLEDKAREIAEASDESAVEVTGMVAVELRGASGYRADGRARGRERPALPYVHVFAMAPGDGLDGGVVITVRSATPEWATAEKLLQSIRILDRSGNVANDDASTRLLPLLDE